jgi:Holliday junction resolvase YEN1
LSGCDYNIAGLRNVGPAIALRAARNGLGKSLCESLKNLGLFQLDGTTPGIFKATSNKIMVPVDFPSAEHVRCYIDPVVCKSINTSRSDWYFQSCSYDDEVLWLLGPRFNIWVKEYIDLILPIILVKSRAQTLPRQETSNSCYQIQHCGRGKKNHVLSKISVDLSAVAPNIYERIIQFSKDH